MTCVKCKPDWFPSGEERHNEGHMAVRLDAREAAHHRAFLNDEDVSNNCSEAIPGNPGLAVLYLEFDDAKKHWCDCGQGAESLAVSGDVRVEQMVL